MACQEKRILITLDKDFGELACLQGAAHCGILRLVNFRAKDQAPVCVSILARHGHALSDGAIVTAEPGRLRIRLRPRFHQ
jgi:predicted nuclease of predicted toxin-antitoxin system